MSFLSQNLSFARLQDRSWRKRHNTLLYLQRVLLVVCILIRLILEVWLLILHPVEVTWLLWREQVIIRVLYHQLRTLGSFAGTSYHVV